MATLPKVSTAAADPTVLFDEDMARLKAARKILARQDAERSEDEYLDQEEEALLKERDSVAQRLAELDANLQALQELRDERARGYYPGKPR